MIRIPNDTPLTADNVAKWIRKFKTEYLPKLVENRAYFRNDVKFTLPFAKKIVTISSAATIGNGIDIKINEEIAPQQQSMYDEIMRLFKRQIISHEDLAIITQGSTYGIAYELGFMSDDEIPVPKVKCLDATNTFVVFDDTVEDNSLYGVYFNEITTAQDAKYTEVYIYDDTYRYTMILSGHIVSAQERIFSATNLRKAWQEHIAYTTTEYDDISSLIALPAELQGAGLRDITPHNMGRMPITVYFNNDEEQGDFEQVKPAIDARNKIHELAMNDAETVASNYLVFNGNEIAGATDDEKAHTVRQIGKTKVIENAEGQDVKILTKQENFSTIAIFGKDVENKIYDLSMVIDFSSDEFAGNVTGVALRLKLFPFKRLVQNKDYFIEKLYRRRMKMYMTGLAQLDNSLEQFDVGLLDIKIKRTWEENILELAQVISTLASTNLFSKKTLIEQMPNGDYEVEITQLEEEGANNMQTEARTVGLDNSYFGDFMSQMRTNDVTER